MTKENFDEVYSEFLERLIQIPRETKKDQKGPRYEWFQQQPEYEDFFRDAIKMVHVTEIDKYKARSENREIKKKEDVLDLLAFTEALKTSIEEYDKYDAKGNPLSFIAVLNKKYQYVEYGMLCEEKLSDSELAKTRRTRINTYIRLIKEMWGFKPELEGEIEESIRTVERERSKQLSNPEHLSNKDKEMVKEYLMMGVDVSIDEMNENGINTDPFLGDMKNPYAEIEEAANEEFSRLFGNLENMWDSIKVSTRKAEREAYKTFLSKDILIQLKLNNIREISEIERKNYGISVEPKCRQWCPQKETCPWKNEEKVPGCYSRYVTSEAGDYDIYSALKPYKSKVCWEIMHRLYTQTAVSGEPETLYKVYANPLKSEFEFTDAVIVTVLGNRKDDISRKRKKYNAVIRYEMKKNVQGL